MADGTPLSLQDARHLLRRTGFGVSQAEATAFLAAHPTRGSAATALLSYKPSGFKPGGSDFDAIHDKWIKYLLKVKSPLQEKLVLFWHDHFATGISKVGDAKRMSTQNRLFRLNGRGNFKTLVKAVNLDPAMMEYLDTVRNDAEIPNENYARELQELFTLGVKDSAGVDNYAQADVASIARAFTGWTYGKTAYFRDYDHDYLGDYPARGPKVIYQSTGGFGPGGRDFSANGEGPQEIDAVVDIIFEHEDSQGKNTVARRTARRLIEFFAHANPTLAFIDDVVSASSFDVDFELTPLLHAIFVHDDFYLTAVPPVGATTPKSVRWPVDLVIGTMRLLKMKPKGKYLYVSGGSYNRLFDQLSNMGQLLFDPPSVFGWDWETSWLSSSTLLARYNFARDIVAARGGGRFRPDKVMDMTLTDPTDIVDAVLDALDCGHNFTASERLVCEQYLTDNGATTPDLQDYDYVNEKLHGLFELVMKSPGYQVF